MKYNYLTALMTFLLVLPMLAAPAPAAGAAETRTVAILPFQVHSETDVDFLRERIAEGIEAALLRKAAVRMLDRDVLAGLAGERPLTEGQALSLGAEVGADFVIMGSVTRLGNIISADVQVVDVQQEAALRDLFAQGSGLESIDAVADDVVSDILLRLFARQRIAAVHFEGNQRVEDAALYNAIKGTTGTLFSDQTLSEDIRTLYAKGHFRDVQAVVTDSPEGRIVTYRVQERFRVAQVLIEGNRRVRERDIREILSVRERQMFDPDKVNRDAENIRILYKERGYLNAEVAFSVEEDLERQDVRVLFTIDEHRKPSIRSISFEGNMVFTDDELKKLMEVSEWGIFSFLTESGLFNQAELQRDIERLTLFYHNNGFIDAQIGEPEITTDDRWIYVTIPVQEGRQYQVGEVHITGDTLEATTEELMEGLQVTRKDYFDREAIVKDLDYLTAACNNEGYAYANVIPQTKAHPELQRIDITFRIQKGRKVSIDTISITGNTRTRDKVIRRQLAIVEGELYNRDKLEYSYEALNRLQYFEEVNFQTERGADDSLMDVNVHVSEKPTGLFSIGAGYSAQEKAIFTAQISERNLFGRGQTIGISGHVGSSSTNYEAYFIEPWLFDIPLWSKYEIWNLERSRDAFDVTTTGLAVTLGYRLFEYVDGYVRYRFSENRVKNVAPFASVYIRDQAGKTASSGMTVMLIRDTRRPWMFPSEGSRNSVSVEHVGGIFQGTTSYTRYGAESRWYFPLPLDNVFSVKGEVGFIHGNEGKPVPVYERYYLGGIGSLRGLREVGPRDPATGDVIGGRTMMVYSAEVLFPLIKDAGIRGVVFYDTGNTWDSGLHFSDLRQTAGAGIRWNSPIGPFRLEWGHVLDRKEGEASNRWEFTIGMTL